MNLLALEASSDGASVAACAGDHSVSRRIEAPRQHARRLLAEIESAMEAAGLAWSDLDGIAFGRGPGAFTGLRIAAGIAQGLSFAANCPVLPISSLEALALGVMVDTCADRVAVCVDARMGEVYWAEFQRDGQSLLRALVPERISAPSDVRIPVCDRQAFAGDGFATYPELAATGATLLSMEPRREPSATDILTLARRDKAAGLAVPPDNAQPVYLRGPGAWRK